MALVKQSDNGEEQIIKPEATAPSIDTSGWPLLLKNWDQRTFTTFTKGAGDFSHVMPVTDTPKRSPHLARDCPY